MSSLGLCGVGSFGIGPVWRERRGLCCSFAVIERSSITEKTGEFDGHHAAVDPHCTAVADRIEAAAGGG